MVWASVVQELPRGSWYLGVSLCLLNCFMSSIGFIMQRKAHLLQEAATSLQPKLEDNDGTAAPMSPKNLWRTGVAIYILAAIPDFLSYALVPQVVCCVVACIRLVVITLLAHVFLKEHISTHSLAGIASCLVGTTLVLYFGPGGDEIVSPPAGSVFHERVSSYVFVAAGCLVLLLIAEHTEHSVRACCGVIGQTALPVATGLAFGLEKVFNTELGFLKPPSYVGDQPMWMSMFGAVLVLGAIELYLNLRGAQRMPISVFAPLVYSISTTLQYFQAAFVFGEFQNMSPADVWMSLLGVCLSLGGGMIIQPGEAMVRKKQPSLMSTYNSFAPSPSSCESAVPGDSNVL